MNELASVVRIPPGRAAGGQDVRYARRGWSRHRPLHDEPSPLDTNRIHWRFRGSHSRLARLAALTGAAARWPRTRTLGDAVDQPAAGAMGREPALRRSAP